MDVKCYIDGPQVQTSVNLANWTGSQHFHRRPKLTGVFSNPGRVSVPAQAVHCIVYSVYHSLHSIFQNKARVYIGGNCRNSFPPSALSFLSVCLCVCVCGSVYVRERWCVLVCNDVYVKGCVCLCVCEDIYVCVLLERRK